MDYREVRKAMGKYIDPQPCPKCGKEVFRCPFCGEKSCTQCGWSEALL